MTLVIVGHPRRKPVSSPSGKESQISASLTLSFSLKQFVPLDLPTKSKSLKRNRWRSSGGEVDPSGHNWTGASMMKVRGDKALLLPLTVPPMSKLGRLRKLFDF